MTEPHVLVLPSWYDTREQPWHGIFFREQALALQESGVKVGVIFPELRSLARFGWDALRNYRFQPVFRDEGGLPTLRLLGWDLFPRLSLHADLWISCANRLADEYVARFGRPDLIHAHSALWGGVAAARWSAHHGVPLVVTEHSSGFATGLVKPWQRRLARRAFEQSAAVTAVSSSLAGILAEQAMTLPGRCSVLPNTVDTSFFTLPARPRSRPPFGVFALGHMKPIKGMDVLLRAFAEVSRKLPEAELEIGGDGPERRRLERLARELGLDGKVRFLGTLDREEVRAAMWRAHLLALPSFYETFGVVAIEAMATGLPVVATQSKGPEETVGPEAGLLIPAHDPAALARAIEEVLLRYDRYDPGRIRGLVVERYGRAAVVKRLKSIYDQVLRACARRG